ncbi:MAG TPA: cupin domain-containing protein [Candidatus Acidoferrales bacterium]|nr:cupin domain-containing protein [Candidatus Acidoferrales bacterium]
MASRRNRPLFSVLALLLFSCAPAHRFYLRYGNELSHSELEQILAKNPLAPDENIKVVTLGEGETVSHHLVQIRDREPPHIHKVHDLTVVVLRGRGYLMLDGKRLELAAGDALYVPRGVPHYFVNESREVAVALVVFSPPFDGKDTIPLKTLDR